MPLAKAHSPSKPSPMGPSPQLLRQQGSAIAALKADNNRLKDELMEESKYSADPTSATAKKLIQNLESQDEVYASLIAEQQKVMENLLAQKAELQAAIASQRAAMGGINRATEVSIRAQRNVVLLENRVQQAAVARSTADLQASKLKERVDGLRREKKLFEELTQKMHNNVAEKAHAVGEVLAQIVEAHDAKGKAEAMRTQVLAQIDKDAAAGKEEWNQLAAMIDGDRARREAEQKRKAEERAKKMQELMQRQREVKAGSLGSSQRRGIALELQVEKEESFDQQEESAERDEEEDESSKGLPAERLQKVEDKLAAVTAAMEVGRGNEESSLAAAQKAVEVFKELKDLCFSLFASLTDAHVRLEELEDRIAKYKARTGGGDGGEAAAAAAAQGGAENLQDAGNDDVEKVEKEVKQAEKQVEVVCEEVLHLCQTLRSSSPEIHQLLLKEGRPTAGTLLQFIGLIEHWISASLKSEYFASQDQSIKATGEGTTPFYERSVLAATALVDPPSVGPHGGHRRSLSGGSSGRTGSSSTSNGGRRGPGNSRKNKGRGTQGRMSQSSSESGSDLGKVLDLEVLAKRAQRAVALRLADAATTTITAAKIPDNDEKLSSKR